MTTRSGLRLLMAPALAACLVSTHPTGAAVLAAAQSGTPPAAAAPIGDLATAESTRVELMQVLEAYPPALPAVLKLDPTLFHDQGYLANYPALAAFAAQHPEVARHPQFFLADVNLGRLGNGEYRRDTARDTALSIWTQTTEAAMILAIMLIVISSLMWLIRTLIDYRRWLRVSRIQTEAHTKLLDRFASNDDVMTYLTSGAGSRFLESAPIVVDSGAAPIGAPVARILWSVQAGTIMTAAGIGLQIVARQAPAEVAASVQGIGAVVVALGIGFILSAGAAYMIGRRMGLLERPPDAEHAVKPPTGA